VSYIKVVLLGIQIITSVIRYLESKRLMDEGARQQIAQELERAQKLVARAKKIQTKVGTMTDEEVNAALRGDFRD
jgi:sensor domain CHASE-containing protein